MDISRIITNALPLILSIPILSAAGCSSSSFEDGLDVETIPFHRMSKSSYCDLPAGFWDSVNYVLLDSSDSEYLLSSADKVIFRDGNFYILDWIKRKLLVFDGGGFPVKYIARRGRGPGEYLQITDFDIDDSGNIWIWDGQKDRMLCYDSDGTFVKDITPGFDARLFKCIGTDGFVFELASWDKSEYRGNELLVSDRELNVRAAFVEYGEYIDTDYELASMGFSDNNGTVIYHQPIDDDVYELKEGIPVKKYHFDFGSKSVPDKYKVNVEKYLNDIAECITLVKTVYVATSFAVGSVQDGGKPKDFIMDRIGNRVYFQNGSFAGLSLVGISGGKAIFRCIDAGGSSQLPDNVRSHLNSGGDVQMTIDLMFF